MIRVRVVIAICGADGWTGIERFGNAKLDWLQQYLALPNGTPEAPHTIHLGAYLHNSIRTSSRRAFSTGRLRRAVYEVTDGQVIVVDGTLRAIRRSHDSVLGKDAIQMVNAWATENELTLAQTDVETDSNEITTIPALLEKLALSGSPKALSPLMPPGAA